MNGLSNSTAQPRGNRHPNRLRGPVITIFVLSLLLTLAACRQYTPPGPNTIGGVVDHSSYLLLDWKEGLRILIWDDIFDGGHSNHGEGSTNDPTFYESGGGQSADGRSYEYAVETRDGLQATFTIDGISYDLGRGNLFLISTVGGSTQVEQLPLDLSSLTPTNTAIEAFGRGTTEIASFIDAAPTPEPPTFEGEVANYTNEAFQISLDYPAHWELVPGYSALGDKFAGDDGFFLVNGAGGGDIDTITFNEAHHKLQPYGSQPTVEAVEIQGQPARYIWPSADANMDDQAALVVQYPQPVAIDGTVYEYFLLYADKIHLELLARTLRFLPAEGA